MTEFKNIITELEKRPIFPDRPPSLDVTIRALERLDLNVFFD